MSKIEDLFPDRFLANAVALILDVSASDEISKSQLTSIKTFGSYWKSCNFRYYPKYLKEIKSLEGLQYLENLESFELLEANIQDFSPISHLKNLRTLTLRNMNIDLTQLTNLPKLSELDLLESETKNMNALSRFSLTALKLDSKFDLMSLPLLTDLRELTISNSKKDDFISGEVDSFWPMPISNIKKFNAFASCLNSIDDYNFITNLPNLMYLNFQKSVGGEKQNE